MTKEEVTKITLKVFRNNGLEKTTINEILKELDSKSAGNLYYYFKNKRAIYQETLNYVHEQILEKLAKVKKNKDELTYSLNLTKALISLFEDNEDMLFFLVNINGSSYIEKPIYTEFMFVKLREVFLVEKLGEKSDLKFQMFLGSIYKVVYVNKILKKRKLTKEEIEDLYEIFWGDNTKLN